jgi:hypothetical protein
MSIYDLGLFVQKDPQCHRHRWLLHRVSQGCPIDQQVSTYWVLHVLGLELRAYAFVVSRIKIWASAADSLVVLLALALEQDEDTFRDAVVAYLRDNRTEVIRMVMGSKTVDQTLGDFWDSEYGDGDGLEMVYLGRDGRFAAKVVTDFKQWAFLMRKEGTWTDFVFLCTAASMLKVTFVCGDFEKDAHSVGPDMEDYLIIPEGSTKEVHLFMNQYDCAWYLGDESKERSEEETGYVKNLGLSREVPATWDSCQEKVHMHWCSKRKKDYHGFFAALACALNHAAGHASHAAGKHTGESVRALVRSHCERNTGPIGKDFNERFRLGNKCMWKIGDLEVGHVPATYQEWLDWNCSGIYEVDGLMLSAAAECLQAQIIVVNPNCECTRAVVCCRVCPTIMQGQIK